jgi:hypothetical protein
MLEEKSSVILLSLSNWCDILPTITSQKVLFAVESQILITMNENISMQLVKIELILLLE